MWVHISTMDSKPHSLHHSAMFPLHYFSPYPSSRFSSLCRELRPTSNAVPVPPVMLSSVISKYHQHHSWCTSRQPCPDSDISFHSYFRIFTPTQNRYNHVSKHPLCLHSESIRHVPSFVLELTTCSCFEAPETGCCPLFNEWITAVVGVRTTVLEKIAPLPHIIAIAPTSVASKSKSNTSPSSLHQQDFFLQGHARCGTCIFFI